MRHGHGRFSVRPMITRSWTAGTSTGASNHMTGHLDAFSDLYHSVVGDCVSAMAPSWKFVAATP